MNYLCHNWNVLTIFGFLSGARLVRNLFLGLPSGLPSRLGVVPFPKTPPDNPPPTCVLPTILALLVWIHILSVVRGTFVPLNFHTSIFRGFGKWSYQELLVTEYYLLSSCRISAFLTCHLAFECTCICSLHLSSALYIPPPLETTKFDLRARICFLVVNYSHQDHYRVEK